MSRIRDSAGSRCPGTSSKKVVFDDPGGSGRAYGDYRPSTHLSGSVTLANGDWRRGGIVFDLDEEWGWEMLDGSSGGLDYSIPFASVAVIEPKGDESVVAAANELGIAMVMTGMRHFRH